MKEPPIPAAAPPSPGWRLTRKKLAIIHVVKSELKLSDEAYHDILKKAAGVDSAKEPGSEPVLQGQRLQSPGPAAGLGVNITIGTASRT